MQANTRRMSIHLARNANRLAGAVNELAGSNDYNAVCSNTIAAGLITIDTLDMGEKQERAMDVSPGDRRSEEQAEAYLFALGVLRDALSGLEAVGIAPNEQCDALGYTLINLLTDHYSEEQALLSFETLHSTLKLCYDAGLRLSLKSTASISHH